MKKILALFLACVLLLTGCGGASTGDAAQVTPEVTAEPTPTPAPVYYNPLNGTELEQPYTGRIVAVSVSNIRSAIPHVGLNQADMVFETFVNGSIIRCLALYTDISGVEAVGGVRSNRLMWNDIATHYDSLIIHSGGSNYVINATANAGLDNINIDQWFPIQAGCSYRDRDHGRVWENSLFGIGSGILGYAAEKKMKLTQPADKEYYLEFVDDGTPDGEAATEININFRCEGSNKKTTMKYDPALDKYVFWQYQQEMRDVLTDEPEAFTNVIVMDTKVAKEGIYHVADFVKGGTGWYANGGQLIPIQWSCDGEDQPFRYSTLDGEPLQMGRGNTYVAIAPIGSDVNWN